MEGGRGGDSSLRKSSPETQEPDEIRRPDKVSRTARGYRATSSERVPRETVRLSSPGIIRSPDTPNSIYATPPNIRIHKNTPPSIRSNQLIGQDNPYLINF